MFARQNVSQTLNSANGSRRITPLAVGRQDTDYSSGWPEADELEQDGALMTTAGRFTSSTWHNNQHREGWVVSTLWSQLRVTTNEQFYHDWASESNRKPMLEAQVAKYNLPAGSRNRRLFRSEPDGVLRRIAASLVDALAAMSGGRQTTSAGEWPRPDVPARPYRQVRCYWIPTANAAINAVRYGNAPVPDRMPSAVIHQERRPHGLLHPVTACRLGHYCPNKRWRKDRG